jgi:hypothetical protein
MPQPGSRTRRAALAAALTAASLAAGCRGCRQEGTGHRGPVVLVTLDALRADAVGAFGGPPGLTPALDALAKEATWAGPAVSASGWTVPSMAALFTGLQPWRNQNWHGQAAVLNPELLTLPEAMRGRGYETTGFYSNVWLRPAFGYNAGFDTFRYFREGRRAEGKLAQIGAPGEGGAAAKPQFVWAHIFPPHAPYLRHDELLGRLPAGHPPLPRRVSVLDLEPWFDPAVSLPPELEATFRAAYQLNVAWADRQLGRLVEALRRSGKWDDTLLVVTSDHGEEFKECGQVEHGGSLCRVLVEVPLIIKLPKGWSGPPLAIAAGERPGTVRVRATILEAVGGKPETFTAPSLFHGGAGGVLSELYLGNGVNRVSYVEGDRQLIWEGRFAPPEPDYYANHTLDLGGTVPTPPSTPPEAMHARLDDAFSRTLPLTGRNDLPPSFSLWRWPAVAAGDGMRARPVPLDEPAAMEAMARRLRQAWVAANGPERPPGTRNAKNPDLTPEEEAEIRALGYAAVRPR